MCMAVIYIKMFVLCVYDKNKYPLTINIYFLIINNQYLYQPKTSSIGQALHVM